MEETLAKKKEVIPELKAAYKRAKDRATDAKAASGQQDRLESLQKELAWAYVAEMEDVRAALRLCGLCCWS